MLLGKTCRIHYLQVDNIPYTANCIQGKISQALSRMFTILTMLTAACRGIWDQVMTLALKFGPSMLWCSLAFHANELIGGRVFLRLQI